jgi:hypothetical protein
MLPASTCVRLSRSELSLISSDPTLIQLYQERGRVSKEIKRDFSILKAAEGTRQHRKYYSGTERAPLNNHLGYSGVSALLHTTKKYLPLPLLQM